MVVSLLHLSVKAFLYFYFESSDFLPYLSPSLILKNFNS